MEVSIYLLGNTSYVLDIESSTKADMWEAQNTNTLKELKI